MDSGDVIVGSNKIWGLKNLRFVYGGWDMLRINVLVRRRQLCILGANERLNAKCKRR